jgi:diguanylate cyclase (GGDEF)-like protein
MSQTSDDSKPCVTVRVADDAERAATEERLHRLGLSARCDVTAGDLPQGVVLQLGPGEPGASATGDVDYQLPLDCSDEALRAAVVLLETIAKLRRRLNDVHRTTEDLAALAATDPLTGLPNRRAWDDACSQAAATADGAAWCVAVLDLDRFKQVNDEQGHAVGDAVLRAAAGGLRRAVRRGDLAARLGGDEFGLLLSGLPVESAAEVVERIRRSVGETVVAAGLPKTTCSAGFAATYEAADAALRCAKTSGRDRTSSG